MARALPEPPLSSLTVSELQSLIGADDTHSYSPKQWLDRAQHEADLAVLAERRGKKEDMFVAYSRCVNAYMNVLTHRDYGAVKKGDAAWAGRVKAFKETSEVYLARAKELKEVLKQRDVERGEGSSSSTSRPAPSRAPSNGPDVHNMGSIADRMAALSGRGMNAAPIPSAKRASVTANTIATSPTAANGFGTSHGSGTSNSNTNGNGRARAGSSASSASHSDKPVRAKGPGPSIPPKPAGVQGPRPPDSRSRSNSKPDKPVIPQKSGEPRSPTRSQTTLPSIPHSPPSKNLSAIERAPAVRSPSPTKADDSMDNFERQFPSLSEFGKQFESDDFQPKVNGLVGPFEHDKGHPELPDISGLPDVLGLPSVPQGAPSSDGLPPPPSRPDRLDSSNSGRPDHSDGPGAVEPPPDSWNSIKRVASEPTVTAPGDRDSIAHADIPTQRSGTLPDHADPTTATAAAAAVQVPPPTAAAPGKSMPKLPPKPKFPYTNAIDPETVREYVLNPSVKMLLLDVRTEEEFKKGHVGKEYEAKGYTTAAVWLDPTVLGRSEMNSTRLENSLSLLPENQQRLFTERAEFDIVVAYDSSSSRWPQAAAGTSVPPLARLWDIIYEHEFGKKLQRNPVLLTGGYEAWSKYQQYRQARYAGVKANGNADATAMTSPSVPVDSAARRANRDMPVYQSADHRSEREEQPSRSYLNKPPIPSPRHSPTYGHSHSQSQGASSSSAYHSISPPAPASIHPGPGSRRRSDYVEHSSAAYAGTAYSGTYQSPPSHHAALPNSIPYPTAYPTGARKIDYPSPHQLNAHNQPHAIGIGANVPQPPPAAQGHAMERHERYDRPDARLGLGAPPMPPQPTHSPGPIRRAPSMRAQEMMAQGSSDEIRYWNDVVLGLTGLKNLGNTCYMNSTLQCLSATYPFTSYFLDGGFKRSINEKNPLGMGGKLAVAFADLLKALWKEEYTFLSPVTFRKNIVSFASQFSGTDQHDSQEFLSFVLDGLHEDLNRVKVKPAPVEMTPQREARLESLPPALASEQEWDIYKQRNDSFIVDLFQGQYRNRLECMTCHKTSTTYDTFMYMSLPVPSNKKAVVVQELIDEFIRVEYMDGEDAWHCPRCKVPRRATKTLTISRLPPVLLIQLKRFTSQTGVFWDKSETPVIFPVKGLELTRYVPRREPTGREDMDDPRTQVGPFVYDLYGVSNHMGTLSSGHYTAYVKSSKGWMYCEDSKISRAHEKDVVSRPAYILFYKRIRA